MQRLPEIQFQDAPAQIGVEPQTTMLIGFSGSDILDRASALARIGVWEQDIRTGRYRWSRGMYDLHEVEPGSPVDQVALEAFFSPKDYQRLQRLLEKADNGKGAHTLEAELLTRRGNRRWIRISAQMDWEGGVPVRRFGISQDITVERLALEEVTRLAERDSLTDLRNRNSLLARLNDIKARGNGVALLMLDLDGFKDVNDGSGHAAGDACLVHFAQRLWTLKGHGRMICRLGGDEFAVVLEDATDLGRVDAVAQTINEAACRPMSWRGQSFQLSASIGYSSRPSGKAFDPVELMREADLALYSAKSNGRNGRCAFSFEMRATADLRFQVLKTARTALAAGQFEVHYQPQIELESGKVLGLEAVLRWRQQNGTLVGPSQFRPALEDAQLAPKLADFVVDTVLAQSAEWRNRMVDFGYVALTLGPRQFRDPHLGAQILGRLRSFDLSPLRLRVQVTEDVLLAKGSDNALRVCSELEAAGVLVAFDDFGTGYASLTHLQEFPVSIIKIHHSFVQKLGRTASSAAIVQALCGLAAGLSKKVVASGVENQSQVQFLRSIGCHAAQGPLFLAPASVQMAETFLVGSAAA